MKSYIIHLERAAERMPRVEYLLQALPGEVEVLPAVDGQKLSNDESAAYTRTLHRPRYPFPLRQSEIACFHSHRRAWKKIANGSDEFAVVAEDDIMLDKGIFSKSFEFATKHMTEDSFIRFPVSGFETPLRNTVVQDETTLFTPKTIGLGMHLQLVGRNYAQKLLLVTESFDRPVDTFLQMHWVTKLVPLSIQPSGTSEMDKDIGGSSIGASKSIAQTLSREFVRPFYRTAIRMRPVH